MTDAAMVDNGNSTATTEPVTASTPVVIQLHNDSSEPPKAPIPSSDPTLSEPQTTSTPPDEPDLFTLPATEALKMLSTSVELLVRMTGDIPPTPPPKVSLTPQMSDMQAEKESIVRSHSNSSLADLRRQTSNLGIKRPWDHDNSSSTSIDGVQLRPAQNQAQAPPINLQHGAITRKFYSKNEPPISIGQYLTRLHQFCPMSSAVYLATSLYIHRLAVEERAIPVTRRNAHRLVLAGLRVAMKALEDLAYAHGKFAKVGGVSETELARLEISFCFLTGFELVVGEETLKSHWEELRSGRAEDALRQLETVPSLHLPPRKDV